MSRFPRISWQTSNVLILLTKFLTSYVASHRTGTENQASSCPCQPRLLWLPLNPMECGNFRTTQDLPSRCSWRAATWKTGTGIGGRCPGLLRQGTGWGTPSRICPTIQQATPTAVPRCARWRGGQAWRSARMGGVALPMPAISSSLSRRGIRGRRCPWGRSLRPVRRARAGPTCKTCSSSRRRAEGCAACHA